MRGGAGGTNNAYRMLGRNKRALGFALYNCRQEVGLSVVCMCAHVCIRCVGAPAAVNARSVPAARVRPGTGQLISKLSTVSYWQPTQNDSTNTNPQQEAMLHVHQNSIQESSSASITSLLRGNTSGGNVRSDLDIDCLVYAGM